MNDTVPIDEMVDGTGQVRQHWRRLWPAVSSLGWSTLSERGTAMDRMFVEDGLAAVLPGAGVARRQLDPIPLVLSVEDFTTLEAGLAQRAQLLEAILADIYGPNTLLPAGLLPPSLIYANPEFLRPIRAAVDDAPPQAPRYLHMYAAELLRAPDSTWQILADRTEDAAGLGYAIDHRRSSTRSLPELFQSERQIRHLRPFLEHWQDSLYRGEPAGDLGEVALLSPGPADKLWFEHVVLAHELSCSLVEPGDLTVRDGQLFLKTLRGLHRIRLLLRRQNGRSLDPLELDAGGQAGVPGLFDAMRSGGVRILNAPGSAMVETPALSAYLPALCQHLLREPLALPDVPTRRLRDPVDRAAVFANPMGWRIRDAINGKAPAVALAELTANERKALAERVATAPDQFIATAVITPSVAPCVGPVGLEPRPILLRMFLIHDGIRWRMMPGGMARVLSEPDARSGRLPLHGLAKDVWVLGDDMLEVGGPDGVRTSAMMIRRTAADMPSRVADNFFWLGRYLERAEGAARLLHVTAEWLQRPFPTPRERIELDTLLACAAAFDLMKIEEVRGASAETQAAVLLGAAGAEGVMLDLLMQISRGAAMLRDRVTSEVHTVFTTGLRSLMDSLRDLPRGRDGVRHLALFNQAMTGVLSFSATVAGLAAENMVRGGGRLFFDLGRRVERARAIAVEVGHVLNQPNAASHPALLDSGLRLALVLRDSVITYRNRYLSALYPAPILDLILADEGNPRALAFQLATAFDLLSELDRLSEQPDRGSAALVMAMLNEVRQMPRDVEHAPNQAAATIHLLPRLHELAGNLAALSDNITREYFALLPAPHGLEMENDPVWMRGAA